jgi:Transcriptional regulator
MKSPSSPGTDRRARVLAAASALFARWGYDKTSVEDIAREAGISKGAVYLEFPGKEELFRAVLYHEFARYTGDWIRRFRSDTGEWSISGMVRHSLEAIRANPLIRALMTRDRRVFGGFLRQDGGLFSALIGQRAELFARLQKAGALRDDIPAPVLAYLVSVIGYALVASDEVVPAADQVGFDEALEGLGLLLDRGLAPKTVKNRRQARALMLGMMERMEEALKR